MGGGFFFFRLSEREDRCTEAVDPMATLVDQLDPRLKHLHTSTLNPQPPSAVKTRNVEPSVRGFEVREDPKGSSSLMLVEENRDLICTLGFVATPKRNPFCLTALTATQPLPYIHGETHTRCGRRCVRSRRSLFIQLAPSGAGEANRIRGSAKGRKRRWVGGLFIPWFNGRRRRDPRLPWARRGWSFRNVRSVSTSVGTSVDPWGLALLRQRGRVRSLSSEASGYRFWSHAGPELSAAVAHRRRRPLLDVDLRRRRWGEAGARRTRRGSSW